MDDETIRRAAAPKATRLEICAALLEETGAETVAEVGVWKGELAEALLRRCARVRRYYLVDPWRPLEGWNKPFNVAAGEFDAIYEEALRRTAFAEDRRVVLRGTTLEAAAGISDGSLDALYVDADHTLRGITIDLVRLFDKVRAGGLVVGDDFSASLWQHGDAWEPTLVFPFAVHFAEARGVPIWALPANQFLIVNDPAAGFRFTDLVGAYPSTELRDLALRPAPPRASLAQRLRRRVLGR